MSGPQVYFSLPPSDLFTFPPAALPQALPPPVRERTFRAPFGIAPWLFNLAMRPEVPFLFASTYILTVFALNAWNRSRGNKPWWIARQSFFKPFVVLHNVALAIYSFATFLAMFRAFVHTWPGWDNANGLAGVADSLCKIHGPRGLGDAVTYNTTINIWESKNALIHMSPNGNPDPTDVGRLWNEGLAFWGWIFYLSKFYEVLDTFIIVAKGKRSATLQTYHHAGAMLCMWAGIRYMSPPIWMFVFINSFIHALMYTYFTLAAINVKVPKSAKRALTTMQIAQFLFGASYAALHLFVQYDIPIATPYKVLAAVSTAASSASSAVASATSEVSKVIESPAATASIGALIKKYLLRAAGEEGVAERVGIPHDSKPVAQHIEERIEQIAERAAPGPIYETRWRTEWTKVNCIDTSGEAFAIYLNLFYLFPLTVLFARFFYKAYMKRTTRPRGASQTAKAIAQDARRAEDETEKAVEAAGKRAEDKVRNSGSKAQKETRDLVQELRDDVKKVKEGKWEGRRVSQAIESFEQKVSKAAESVGDVASAASTPKKNSPKKKNKNKNKQAVGGEESEASTPSKNESDVKDELAPKVELKLEDSEAAEPSDKENQPPSTPSKKPSQQNTEQSDNQGGLFTPSKDDEKPAAETEKVPAQDEPADKQDANLAESEPTRPAPEGSAAGAAEPDSPSSATTSQSASFIDYADAVKSGELPEESDAPAEPEASEPQK